MIPLLATILLFVPAGAAAASLLRLPSPATIAGRIAFWYLAGIAAMGTILYALGVVGVPLTRATLGAIAAAALVLVVRSSSRLRAEYSLRHPAAATMLLVAPLLAVLLIASILPVRDYDGRVTWLPKAHAIARSGTIDGPFFQGEAGLNLHNRYPLLMPLNAAAVLVVTGRDHNEAARWLYPLVLVAALVASRDLIALSHPRCAAWVIAACAWLPMFLSVEGGAHSAYNDVPVLALTGLAVISMHTPQMGSAGVRVAALALPALVLLKNEGVVIALAVLVSAAVMRRLNTVSGWATAVLPVAGAVVLLLVWRRSVPAAYDEQYEVLVRTLPEMLHRLPAAAGAVVRHATDRAAWGWFWPVTAVAALVALSSSRRATALGPLLVIVTMLGVYVVTFAVTSWDIGELAQVAGSRLLLHLVMPACVVIAVAGEWLSSAWKVRSCCTFPRARS